MSKKSYEKRINLICDYIYEHLDQDLSIENLSKVANFSKYHFHRQFSEYTGVSVYKFVQLLRLKRASYQLVYNKGYKHIDIAMDAGFENPESFSRAFKNKFGQTPSDFRDNPKWKPWHQQYHFKHKRGNDVMQVKLVEFPETRVAVLEHRGDPELINDSVSTFIEWRKNSQLSPVKSSDTFGLIYDDPKTTTPEKFRFDICGSVKSKIPENKLNVINKVIAGGRCAVVRHLGSLELIDSKVHYLYGEWLPECKEELRDSPCFFHYINMFPDVAEHELVTDIYLPLK